MIVGLLSIFTGNAANTRYFIRTTVIAAIKRVFTSQKVISTLFCLIFSCPARMG
ncbi:MAG: hypothetical protein ACFFCI_05545 [Promethearchaeota archaeon]